MKPKKNTGLLYVGSGNLKTQLNPQGQLPKLLKQIPLPNEPIVFTRQDVIKIIENIMKRGIKFSQLKKELDCQFLSKLEKRVSESSFMQFAVRKQMNQMGDQRRLGTGLRGFSRLLLEEFQYKCWPMIQLEISLMLKEIELEEQKQKIESLFHKTPTSQQCSI